MKEGTSDITRLAINAICLLVIFFSLVVFISSVLRNSDIDGDYYVFYTSGTLWSQGQNNYDAELVHNSMLENFGEEIANSRNSGNLYPPLGSVFFSFLSRFPVQTANMISLVLNLALLGLCLFMFARLLSQYRPVGLFEITLLITFINTGFGRANVRQGQVGIIICTLIMAAFLLERRGKQIGAGLSFALASLKPTFLFIYPVYYLLRRSWKLLITMVVCSFLLAAIPLVLSNRPVVETLLEYSTVARNLDSDENSPSPDVPHSAMMTHFRPLVFRIFNQQSQFTELVALGVSLAALGLALYLMIRSRSLDRSSLLDFSLISALSLLVIYHRFHDVFLLFPGIIYIYVYAMRTPDTRIRLRWIAVIAVALFLMTLPGDLVFKVNERLPAVANMYLWKLISPFLTWAGVLIFITLIWLKFRSLKTGDPLESE